MQNSAQFLTTSDFFYSNLALTLYIFNEWASRSVKDKSKRHELSGLNQLQYNRSRFFIKFFHKLCLIMHFVHTNRAPQYLSDCVQTAVRSSNRPGLRSSYTAAYANPRCRTKFGERGFRHAGPTAWNSLPDHVHQINDTSLFTRCLKTELFRRAYHR